MTQLFLLQIVNAQTHQVVARFPGGGKPPRRGTMEADCVEHLAHAVVAQLPGEPNVEARVEAAAQTILRRPVGLFRSQTTVAQTIRDGLREAFLAESRPDWDRMVREGLEAGLQTLKDETATLV